MADFDFLDESFKKDDRGPGNSLDAKLRVMLPALLTAMHKDGWADLDKLEAANPLVSGRWRLTAGAGVAGKGGLRLIRQGTVVKAWRDNVINCADRLRKLDVSALERWVKSVGLTPESFAAWVGTLPRA